MTAVTANSTEQIDRLRASLNRTLRGKPHVIEYVIACLLARGHLLLEDLPGLGKTTLAKAVAAAVGGKFARVQCTPDLLPGDGDRLQCVQSEGRGSSNSCPARSSPMCCSRTRSTARLREHKVRLLEAMAERQATVDNVRHAPSPTFFVIATQNPVEHHGTYPLPEARLDRFAMKLSVGYPDRAG